MVPFCSVSGIECKLAPCEALSRHHLHRPIFGGPLRCPGRRAPGRHALVPQVHRRLPHQHRRRSGAARTQVRRHHTSGRRAYGPASSASNCAPKASTYAASSPTPSALTALVLLGIRDRERFPLIFYRENCADMALSPDDIDPDFIAEARCVLASGTHLSHPRTEAATLRALDLARESGRADRPRHRLPAQPVGASPGTATGRTASSSRRP